MFCGVVSVKLSKPVVWEGREISSVDLDFSKVNGEIINKCERAISGNTMGSMPSFSSEYCGNMAALISGIPFRALEKMPFADYNVIRQTVGAFVMEKDPLEFYNQFVGNDDAGFTSPAAAPEESSQD